MTFTTLLQSVLYDISSVSSQLDRHAVELLRHSYFFPLLTALLITIYLHRCRAKLPAKIRYVDPTWVSDGNSISCALLPPLHLIFYPILSRHVMSSHLFDLI